MPASFRGTFENRLDKKGRVSVPGEFRSQLRGLDFDGISVFPSMRYGTRRKALECSGADRMAAMSASIPADGVMPDQSTQMIKFLLGRTRDLGFDGEGRIVLPEVFVTYLGLGERITFVGQGPYFEMWDSAQYAQYEIEQMQQGLAVADQMLASQPPLGSVR